MGQERGLSLLNPFSSWTALTNRKMVPIPEGAECHDEEPDVEPDWSDMGQSDGGGNTRVNVGWAGRIGLKKSSMLGSKNSNEGGEVDH